MVSCPECGQNVLQPLPPETELRGGRYRIERVLGRGGFGITYLASDTHFERSVAIKEYFPVDAAHRHPNTGEITISRSDSDRFERGRDAFGREGKSLARIRHPNVATVHDIFDENNTAYLVIEYLAGHTLRREMDSAPLPEPRIRQILWNMVTALEVVHAEGIYHLDLKPANVMCCDDGRVVLIDFGTARRGNAFSGNSVAAITPGYAAPELLTRGIYGPQTDLFSLGVMLYQMLTGKMASPARIEDKALWKPEELGEPWRTLVQQATAPEPEDRPASLSQWWAGVGMAGDRRVTRESQPPAEPPGESMPPSPAPRRSPKLPWLILGVGVLALSAYALSALKTTPGSGRSAGSQAKAEADSARPMLGMDAAIEEARKTAQSLLIPYQRTLALTHVARVEARAGNPTAARETLQSARKLAEEMLSGKDTAADSALRAVARTQAEIGYSPDARDTAGLVEDTGTRALTLRELAEAMARSGDTDGARETLKALQEVGEGPELSGHLCSAYGALNKALAEQKEISGLRESLPLLVQAAETSAAPAFNLLYAVEASIGMEDMESARRFITMAEARHKASGSRGQSRVGFYANLGNLYASLQDMGQAQGAWASARDAANQLESREARLTGFAYLIQVITAEKHQVALPDTLKLAKSVLEQKEADTRNQKSRVRLSEDYPEEVILAAQAEVTGYDSARELAATIENSDRRLAVLAYLARLQAASGDPAAARKALGTIWKGSFNQMPTRIPHTLSRIAEAQAALGDSGDALATAAQVPDTYQRALAYCRVAEVLAGEQPDE